MNGCNACIQTCMGAQQMMPGALGDVGIDVFGLFELCWWIGLI